MKTPGPAALVALVVLGTLGPLLSSCSEDSAPTLVLQIEEIPSPARGWSAQPHLAPSESGVVLSWLETRADADGRETTLWMDRWSPTGWSGPRAVAHGSDLLVNWADYPSVIPLGDEALVAHWLVRGGRGGEDYGVRVAASRDGGRSWSEPWTPHEDRSATAHGFATLFPLNGGFGVVWLDGRGQAGNPEGDVSLWFREMATEGTTAPGVSALTSIPEVMLDGRTCECCQTDAAVTADGPLVAYRDRSPAEIRDIRVIRRVGERWQDPTLVHEDGWLFPACPINGPAVDAHERRVAVAWFTAADETPRIRLAFSTDAGASFAAPVRIDDGSPSGRVDVVLLTDGSAVVSWLERVEGGTEVRARRVSPSGGRSAATRIAATSGGQASGFPQMVEGPGDDLVFAWTDSRSGESRIRLARARPGGPP
ncbi:MAG: sialidase family protein [Longimicrobiales bacterium]|nr:sialidase family protein [Longimicrobiales bacterium]